MPALQKQAACLLQIAVQVLNAKLVLQCQLERHIRLVRHRDAVLCRQAATHGVSTCGSSWAASVLACDDDGRVSVAIPNVLKEWPAEDCTDREL